MSTYFNLNNLLNTKSMPICYALLKYGYSNFSLEILEYCEPSAVISREQYYLARLKPQYNILPTAGWLVPLWGTNIMRKLKLE